MIQAVIYDKAPNTNAGVMTGEMRVVGYNYLLPGGDEPTELKMIVEDLRRETKVLVLTYDNEMQQIIPDRGVEKILKFM